MPTATPSLFSRRRGLAYLCSLSVPWAAAGPPAAEAPAEIKPTLRVGWDDYPPYQMQQGPQLAGLDIELVTALLAQAGYQPLFVRAPWQRQLMGLQDGSIDLVMNASRAPERAAYAVWTEAYREERAALMVLAERLPGLPAIDSLQQLSGQRLRIGLVRGSSYPGEFDRLSREPAFQRLLAPIRVNQQSLGLLRAGRVDLVVDDPVALLHQARSTPGPAVAVLHEFYVAPTHLMLARHSLRRYPQLLEALNEALATLRRDGRWRTLQARYGVPAGR